MYCLKLLNIKIREKPNVQVKYNEFKEKLNTISKSKLFNQLLKYLLKIISK